ncbi:MAG: 50S ribosomal protein L29, partial [Chloroflexi bacterium RBG_13_56_8]
MKMEELQERTQEELLHIVDELYQEQFNLKFQMATRQLTDTSRLRQVRRDIARAKT